MARTNQTTGSTNGNRKTTEQNNTKVNYARRHFILVHARFNPLQCLLVAFQLKLFENKQDEEEFAWQWPQEIYNFSVFLSECLFSLA